jgi:hypothetical protein
MPSGQPRHTRISASRRVALMLATLLGLLSITTITAEASQASKGPLNNESSQSGSDNPSRKLNNSNGVISPPVQVDPQMSVKPPNDAGSMRIVPPPGTAGGNQNVQPK